MKNVERINALNKMLLNANVVAYGAMVDFFNISLYSISILTAFPMIFFLHFF